jgi:hypothetical protein
MYYASQLSFSVWVLPVDSGLLLKVFAAQVEKLYDELALVSIPTDRQTPAAN